MPIPRKPWSNGPTRFESITSIIRPELLLKSHTSYPRHGIGLLAGAEQEVWGSASATPGPLQHIFVNLSRR